MIVRMKSWLQPFSLAASFGLLVISCTGANKAEPKFDGQLAYELLVKQVNFGPRVPGTEPWKQCRSYFYDYFQKLGVGLDSQAFDFLDPYSQKTVPLVNVMARIKGADSNETGIMFMAHYDSRPRTDFPSKPELAKNPIAGANDGASGVAVLLEMARLLSQTRPPHNVDLVLVDGEDWGESGDPDYYLLGSREFAKRGVRGKYRFAILVDMVGDSDQQIYRETFSQEFHPELNDMIWETARKLSVGTFIDSTVHTVLDDHIALATTGVPAVDLIDFNYTFWHTDQDTSDKCSAQSLENVGKVLTLICYHPELWPKKK